MKRNYQKPAMLLADIETINMLAASTSKDPNQVTGGGSGTHIGGYSQESSNEDKDGDGSPDDMAKAITGNLWDDE